VTGPKLFGLEARPIVGAAVMALEAVQVAALTKQCEGSEERTTREPVHVIESRLLGFVRHACETVCETFRPARGTDPRVRLDD
jgi:hypothetical protein